MAATQLREPAALTTKSSTASANCSPEDLAAFEIPDSDPIDLDREMLPRGLYLATVSEMILEKKSEQVPVRLIVRESASGKLNRDVVCAEGVSRLGSDFEMAITGAVKFETGNTTQGGELTLRQFQVFTDKGDYGVVVSTPKAAARGLNLKQAMSGSAVGQLFKIDDRNYVLRFTREKDGVRARLQVRLEFIPQT